MIGIITNNVNMLDLDKINEQSSKADLAMFHDNVMPAKRYENISSFSKYSSYDFRGSIISTCLLSCAFTMNNPSCERLVFWPQTIEWDTWPNFFYKDLENIIFSNKVKILSTDKNITQVFTEMFRAPDLHMDEFDIEVVKEELL